MSDLGTLFKEVKSEYINSLYEEDMFSLYSKDPHYLKFIRINTHLGRRYATIDNNEVIVCNGITGFASIVDKAINGDHYLTEWKINNKDHETLSNDASHFGTLGHYLACFNLQVFSGIKNGYSLDYVFDNYIMEYMNYKGVNVSKLNEWKTNIEKSNISLYEFYNKYEIEPISFEYVVKGYDNIFATPIDLVAYYTDLKTKKRKKGLFNFKFRQKANFYFSDTIQNSMEINMYNETMRRFGGEEAASCFCLIPDYSWRKHDKKGDLFKLKETEIIDIKKHIDYFSSLNTYDYIFKPDIKELVVDKYAEITANGVNKTSVIELGDYVRRLFKSKNVKID